MKALLLLLLLTLPRLSVAQRCKCIDDGLPQEKKIADAYRYNALVFTGRVLRADTLRAGEPLHGRSQFSNADTVYPLRHSTVRYTFAISRLLKGPAGTAATVLVTARPDADGCGMTFRPDTDYLIHAYWLDLEEMLSSRESKRIPRYLATGPCGRPKELRAAPPAELRQLAWLAAQSKSQKAPAGPAATPAGRKR
jgi:hypothetical protein